MRCQDLNNEMPEKERYAAPVTSEFSLHLIICLTRHIAYKKIGRLNPKFQFLLKKIYLLYKK